MSILFIADYGGLSWHVHDVTNDSFQELSEPDFLALDWLPHGSTLVVENAHLGVPRTELSLAQVYTGEELLKLYSDLEAKHCKLALFPQGLTPKAREMAGVEYKSDRDDLIAIAWYINNVLKGDISSLRKPPASFETPRRVEASWTFKNETNAILNVARRFKYQKADDHIAALVNSDEFLTSFANSLSPNGRHFFHLTEDYQSKKTPGKWNKNAARTSRLYTTFALFMKPDGSMRKRPDTNDLPGLNWLKRYALNMGPFHFKGGIARSNLKWHAFRNEAISALGTRNAGPGGKVLSHYAFSPAQQDDFRQVRKSFMRALTEVMQAARSAVKQRAVSF